MSPFGMSTKPLFPAPEQEGSTTAVDPHAPVVLTGEVGHVIYSSGESGFRVLRVKLDASCGGKGAVVAGRSSTIHVGDRIRAVGRWKSTKHGLQLDSETIVALDAVSVEGLARSLDGLVVGLGPARARRFVDALGGAEDAIRVLDQVSSIPSVEGEIEIERAIGDPATLVGSLGWMPYQVRLDLVLAWKRNRVEREVEAQLASLDLPSHLRGRLVARYGADAARVVLKEPYRLPAEIDGVGFLTADDIALKVGVDVDSVDRIDAAVMHVLRDQAEDGGHTVCSTADVSRSIFQLFMQRRPPAPVVEDGVSCVEQAVERLIEKKRVASGSVGICLPELARAEQTIAKMLNRLLTAERAPLEFAGAVDPKLTDEQQLAVRSVFERGVCVLTGGPGCLTGDAVIGINRGGAKKKISLKELVRKFNGGISGGTRKHGSKTVRSPERKWDLTIDTMVQCRTEDGFVRLSRLVGAYASGVKTVYEITLTDGRSVTATEDHRFLTTDGWKRLGDVRVGDRLYAVSLNRSGWTPKAEKLQYKQTSGLRSHPFAGRFKSGGRFRFRVPTHRLVVEARINGLELDVFLKRIRDGLVDDLTFLNPADLTVHHDDRDVRNNEPSNLKLRTPVDHAIEHGIEEKWHQVAYRTYPEKVVSIRLIGDRETFDLALDDPHNFIANGFVVHNSGKTHTCKEIVRVARSLGLHVALCAPTARAAKRLSEMTEDSEAVTIHRLLEAKGPGRFDRNADNPIAAELIVADESSMIDVSLMAALLSAVNPLSRLVLVGDKDQLPPVGPGAPFRDVIASGAVPVARLTKIHRQAAGSAIVRVAHGVLHGAAPCPSSEGDRADGCLHFVKQPNADEAAKLVVRIVLGLREELGIDPWEALVLAPMRKGSCGVLALNTALQKAMNPPHVDLPEIAYGKEESRRIFRRGDRVRQTKNDYERGVVNGDVGRIVEIYPEKGRPRGGPWLDVDFPGVGVVHYDGMQLSNLVLAYCTTIHSAQGGQGPAVILALVDQHYVMLTRTLLYTAITRAEHACLIVGSRRALETAARNARDDARRTTLPRLLLAKKQNESRPEDS